ncbi:MAG: hypothetical protein Q8R79_03700 [Legionellaceae bacterium]|nr:hypothetical protein [Legionellaceae bacterium]
MSDNLFNIRQLPKSLLKMLDKLIVNRIGSKPNATMITRDIVGFISAQKKYQLVLQEKTKSAAIGLHPIESEHVDYPSKTPENLQEIPPSALLTGEWLHQETHCNPEANILGGMGQLILQNETCHIPVIEATPTHLAYYNAYLIPIGGILQFETQHDLPITKVWIGENYVQHYLSEEKHGGGEYIEYHDQPHLWAPQSPDCSGHILLGHQEHHQFYLTGFKIPFGYAVYMSPYTLHSDAYLIGEHLVVYTVTDDYSTALIMNQHQKPHALHFEKSMGSESIDLQPQPTNKLIA